MSLSIYTETERIKKKVTIKHTDVGAFIRVSGGWFELTLDDEEFTTEEDMRVLLLMVQAALDENTKMLEEG